MADSPFANAARLTGVLGGAALRPVAGAGRLGIRATLAVVGGFRALPQRAVSGALEGPMVEAVTREVIRHQVLERVTGELVASEAVGNMTETVLAANALGTVSDRVLASGAVDAVVERVLADGVVEQAAARVLDGPELERVVSSALDSPAMERLVARVVESKLVDQAMARLLESDELWLFVDEIAHSPAVTDAIAQQTVGFADQVAGGVRTRSRSADTWLEAKVQRALRRQASR
jgi:hypothetical protein